MTSACRCWCLTSLLNTLETSSKQASKTDPSPLASCSLLFLTSCFLLLAACASQASKTDLSPRASCSFGSSILASCCLLLVISPLTRSFCCKRGRRIFYTPRSRIGAWRLKRNEIEQNMAKHLAKTRKTFLEGHRGYLGHPGHTWHCKEEHQRLANRTLGVVEEMIGIRTVFDLQEHFLQLSSIICDFFDYFFDLFHGL